MGLKLESKMKIKRYLMNLMTIGLIALSLQPTYQAASFNHVDRVLTVMPGEKLQGSEMSYLGITLIDELEQNAIFYLDITGAKWLDRPFDGGSSLEIKRLSQTRLQVKAASGNISAGTRLSIPMQVEMTASQATVHIKGNNTVVTSGSYLLAETASYKGEVTVDELPMVVDHGIMADIHIEEPFSRAFAKAEQQGCSRKVQLQLNHNGYAFDLAGSNATLIGSQGFEGINGDVSTIRQIDAQTLEITLPDITSSKYTGRFTLSGVSIRPSDKSAEEAVLKVTTVGDLVKKTQLEVLSVTDYAITLSATQKKVRGGTKQPLHFNLKEVIEDSLMRNRATFFTFDRGVTLDTTPEGKVAVRINGQETLCESILDDAEKVVGFKVVKLPLGHKSYDFVVNGNIEIDYAGTVAVSAEGRSLLEDLKTPILNVYKPFHVKVEAMNAVVGLKDQVGGKISLSEQFAGEFIQGEKIILSLEESAIKYGKLPKVEVTRGDLRLGQAVISGNRIELPIVRRSNTASTIVISYFNVTVDQTVAVGNYNMQIGGGAFSSLAHEGNLLPVWQGPFVGVSEKVSVPNVPVPAEKQETVRFIMGSTIYYVGQEAKMMDAAPYISSGRTMLPVKYVADAIGIAPGAVAWDGQHKTVTIYAADTIVLQLGSTTMKIGDEEVTMSAAPEAVNGRTFIPVAEITRALQIDTKWDGINKEVFFTVHVD